MSLPVVEVALFPLQEHLVPDQAFSDPAGQEWRKLSQFLKTRDRAGNVWFGLQVEKATWAALLTEWETKDAHWDFQATPEFPPFIGKIGSLMIIPEHRMLHVEFDPPLSTVLRQPKAVVAEVIMLYFPPHSHTDVSAVQPSQQKFAAMVQREVSPDSFYGASGGWIDVLLNPPGSAGMSKVYMALFSWASVEAYTKFKESQAYKDNIQLLVGLKGLKATESFYFVPRELAG